MITLLIAQLVFGARLPAAQAADILAHSPALSNVAAWPDPLPDGPLVFIADSLPGALTWLPVRHLWPVVYGTGSRLRPWPVQGWPPTRSQSPIVRRGVSR